MSKRDKSIISLALVVCMVTSCLVMVGVSFPSTGAQLTAGARLSSNDGNAKISNVIGGDSKDTDELPAAISSVAAEYTPKELKQMSEGDYAELLNGVIGSSDGDAKATVESVFAQLTKYGIINESIVTLNGKIFDISTIEGAAGALTAVRSLADLKYFSYSGLETLFYALLSAINTAIPMPADVVAEADYVSEDFYAGHDSFAAAESADSVWSLGYSQRSLVPNDVLTKNYYLGGYLLQNFPSNTVETILDDMKVRTVALNDGRGIVILATVDSIGIANSDVRRIRAAFEDKYAGTGEVVSVNVYTTHCHSCIDTQGLWNPFFLKMGYNYIANSTNATQPLTGPDEDYMLFLIDRVSDSMVEAVTTMTEGELYSCSTDITDYVSDHRYPYTSQNELNRLRFVPTDSSLKETWIVNMPSHPYITGLKTDKSSGKELSADYIYYIEEIVNKAGHNFYFVNGAICGIYCSRGITGDGIETVRRSEEATRYGNEIGRILVGMNMTEEEIVNGPDWLNNTAEAEAQAAAGNTGYTIWYEDWQPVAENVVDAVLNVAVTELFVPVTNPVIQAVGKLNLANNNFVALNDGTLCTISEIGYMEIGTDIKVALVPGEFSPELVTGGGCMDAETSFSGTDYAYPCFNEVVSMKLGKEVSLWSFGEFNDGCGYVVPDNDFAMIFFDDDFFGNHYQETISYGEHTASAFSQAFIDLVDDITYA